jgi:hypothetical protein
MLSLDVLGRVPSLLRPPRPWPTGGSGSNREASIHFITMVIHDEGMLIDWWRRPKGRFLWFG